MRVVIPPLAMSAGGVEFQKMVLWLTPIISLASALTPQHLLCKSGETVRSVRVESSGSEGCKVLYTKGGRDQNVGGGKGSATCSRIVENIRSNLTAAGYACRNISAQSEVIQDSGGEVRLPAADPSPAAGDLR